MRMRNRPVGVRSGDIFSILFSEKQHGNNSARMMGTLVRYSETISLAALVFLNIPAYAKS